MEAYQHMNQIFPDDGFVRGTSVLKIECTESNVEYDMFTSFLILFGLLQLSLFCSGVIIGNLLSSSILDVFKKAYVEPVEPPPKYEELYPIERAVNTNDDLNNNSYITDATPDGLVIMRYDKDEEGFIYWSDRNVRFNYLETVARKYVTNFNCSQYYIERECNKKVEEDEDEDEDEDRKQSDNEESSSKSEENNKQDNEEENKPNPFATLKQYKNNTGNKTQAPRPTKMLTGCKFVKRGKISEFEFTQSSHIEIEKPNQKMDFETFKKMFFGKKNDDNNTNTNDDNINEDDKN